LLLFFVDCNDDFILEDNRCLLIYIDFTVSVQKVLDTRIDDPTRMYIREGRKTP